MFHSYQKLFFLILLMSIIFQMSSLSWFSIWMMMEMNMMSFIPFLTFSDNQLYNEGSMKYFIVQSFGSVMLLMGWMISTFTFFTNFYFENIYYMMLYMALILKMGASPFHFWFPSLMNNLNWFCSFLLMTWQKLGPLMMLSYVNQLMIMLFMSSGLSALVGGIGGFNQTNLRMIFAYSSINHLGWLMICLILTETIFIFYVSFYFFMMILFCLIFHLNMLSSLIQLYCFKSLFMEKYIIMINLLSLGGLPPFSGFFLKWVVLNELLMEKMWMMSLILLVSSLMNLYYYIRISYSYMMFSSMNMNLINFNLNNFNKFFISIILLIKMIGIILIPLGMWMY
uniref:NADH-ubiquinone oxidoreductase chain 2 n=1 Tax=Peripatoides sympatrica TaxID=123609 RepID=G1CDS8_9BILA|nr:NADH dehydrogenase subunit 2 [Peripatoides sympatrica]